MRNHADETVPLGGLFADVADPLITTVVGSIATAIVLFAFGCSNEPAATPSQQAQATDTIEPAEPQVARPRNIAHDVDSTVGAPQDSDLELETSGTGADAALSIGATLPEDKLANQFPGLPQNARELALMRAKYDEAVWSDEVLAQEYERTFTRLWDNLIHHPDKYEVLRGFPFTELVLGGKSEPTNLDWGIELHELSGAPITVPHEQWLDQLRKFEDAGYQIVETEWHHQEFRPAQAGSQVQSKVSFVLHIDNQKKQQRYIVRGVLQIGWASEPAQDRVAVPGRIEAQGVQVLSRSGLPVFAKAWVDTLRHDSTGVRRQAPARAVIIHDLDDDGKQEVVVGGANIVYYQTGEDWQFSQRKLCAHPSPAVNAGLFADFTGDGVTDYVCAVNQGFPRLYPGRPGGVYSDPPQELRFTSEKLVLPTAITAGDIDHDGDMDLFIGQLRSAYESGEVPTPYYDANDGYPSYLLINDGQGNFSDNTVRAGLGAKRHRRMFSASLVDLDGDGDLDLLTSSDFAGADLYLNDGQGHFSDASDRLQPKGYAFGMSHSFADYNLDGQLDFILVGMSSTTARRLEQMGLGRDDFPTHNEARMWMGYGNRLFLGQNGHFKQAPFNDTVARTGWSWGCTSLDFDNDADSDLFIVNGQFSGKTTTDYCTRFWCHDIYYSKESRPDGAIREFFQMMMPLFQGEGPSWNGYEHNALLMNLSGRKFVNVAFLMGVSHEVDSRMAVSGDLDSDGRVDIVFEQKDHRNQQSKLYFLRNEFPVKNHWVGVHLRSRKADVSPLGAKVLVRCGDGKELLQHNLSGHSVWAQHSNTVHFGLGPINTLKAIQVIWPDGSKTELQRPAVNTYHVVEPRPGA